MDEDKFVLVGPSRKRSAAELSVASSSSKHARTSRSIVGGRGRSGASSSSSRMPEHVPSQPIIEIPGGAVGEGMLWDALAMSINSGDRAAALERMEYLRAFYGRRNA